MCHRIVHCALFEKIDTNCFGIRIHSNEPRLMISKSSETEEESNEEFITVKTYENDIDLLYGQTASDWVYDKTIVKLHEDTSVKSMLELMHDANAGCCLIYDGNENFLGTIDKSDIIKFIIKYSTFSISCKNS